MVSAAFAQEKETKFEMKFFKDKGAIGIICNKGCTWSDLQIRINNFYMNQFGMVNIDKADEINNSDFIFSVKRKGNTLYLKAKKGLNWKELSFKLSKDKLNSVIVNDTKIII